MLSISDLPAVASAAQAVVDAIKKALDPTGPKGKTVTLKELVDIVGHCAALIAAIVKIIPIK